MNELYSFEVLKTTEVEEKEEKKNEKGESITVSKKVNKEIPIKVVLTKPTYALQEAGSEYYDVILSKAIAAGIMPKALMRKHRDNAHGVLTDEENKDKEKLTKELEELDKELRPLILATVNKKEEKDFTDEEKKKNEEIKSKIDIVWKKVEPIRLKLLEYDEMESALFQYSAENRAKTKTIIWWFVHLTHIENDKKELVPLFGDGDVTSKFKKYEELESKSEPFYLKAGQKALYFISVWYGGYARTTEEFKEFEKRYATQSYV